MVGFVGVGFLLFSLAFMLMGKMMNRVLFVVGMLLVGLAAVIVFFSAKAYYQGRRELLSDDFKPVEVTCLAPYATSEVLGEDTTPTLILHLRFIDQAGRSYDWRCSSPSPEIEAITEGSRFYLVAVKSNSSWRTFQVYATDEWELDW